jgi:hypothetical protein
MMQRQQRPLLNDRLSDWVIVVDIEGDGTTEVLAAALDESGRSALYCFESDGRVRFRHEVSRTVRFGSQTFGPPFLVRPPLVTRQAGRTSLWVLALHSEFPATLQKLGPLGEVLGEYWQAGHPGALRELERDGRRLILVGGIRNEDSTGTLTVLDADDPTGSAPAEKDKYRCANCPEAPPLVFMTFPQVQVGRLFAERAEVIGVEETPGQRLRIHVFYAQLSPGEAPICRSASAIYLLDGRFRVVSAEFGDGYVLCHAQLRRSGKLDHDFGPRDVAELFPVWRWREGVAERIDGPEVTAPAEAPAAGPR